MKNSSESNIRNPEKNLKFIQILSLGLAAIVLVSGLLWISTEKSEFNINQFVENLQQPMQLVLFIVGLVLLYIRIPISKMLLKSALKKNVPQNLNSLLEVYITPFVIRMALAHSASSMGRLSAYTSREASGYAILSGLAIVVILLDFPTFKKIKERVQEIDPRIQV